MINYPFASPHPPVPYQFPQVSWLKLQDYITNLVNQYGGVYWPLDDAVNNPYNRAINTAVAVGRELVLNGGFDSDTLWTKGVGATISGGLGHLTGVLTGVNAFNPATAILQLGRVYQITFTVLNYSSGAVRFRAGLSGAAGTNRSANGTFTETVICTVGITFSIETSGTTTLDVDNVSVKELNIPASTAVPIQLLNTDVWNGLGVGAWTALNSATLSAQTTTRHDGISGTVLRVARGAVTPGGATRTLMTVGLPYRVYGWARGDGTCSPVVRQGVITQFTGISSTDWQPFDSVFVASSTDIQLNTSGGANGNFVEYDVTVVALDTGIRQDNPVVNGNFSSAATWALSAGWTISGGVLVATAAGTGSLATEINVSVTGKSYLVTYDVVVTSGSVAVRLATTAGSTRSVSGTYSEVILAGGISLNFNPISTFTGTIDNVTVIEISPLAARPVNGAVLGNAESNRLLESVSFDGVNDLINLYSPQLNSVINPNEFTILFFFKAPSSVWTSGVGQVPLVVSASSANDFFQFKKPTTNNSFQFNFESGGVGLTITKTSYSPTNYQCLTMTFSNSNNRGRAWVNGAQEGADQTGLGTFVGNLISTQVVAGGNLSGVQNPFPGNISQIVFINAELSDSEIAEIAKLGDTA